MKILNKQKYTMVGTLYFLRTFRLKQRTIKLDFLCVREILSVSLSFLLEISKKVVNNKKVLLKIPKIHYTDFSV